MAALACGAPAFAGCKGHPRALARALSPSAKPEMLHHFGPSSVVTSLSAHSQKIFSGFKDSCHYTAPT